MKRSLTLMFIGWVALSSVGQAEDFSKLPEVQHALDYVELGLIQGKAYQEVLTFQRVRYFVLTDDKPLSVDSPEFSWGLPPFEKMALKISAGFVMVLKTLDYAEAQLVQQRANFALDAFEKCRAYALTDDKVLHVEANSQLQKRMEDLKASVDNGRLRETLETPPVSLALLVLLRGENETSPIRGSTHGSIPASIRGDPGVIAIGTLPWPLCVIVLSCDD